MKKRVYLSLAVIALAMALVGGATMAWFFSSVEIDSNIFEAGRLRIDFHGTDVFSSRSFAFQNMQPGDTVDYSVQVENTGSLDFKFALIISETSYEFGDDGRGNYGGYLPEKLNVTVDMGGKQIYTGTLANLMYDELVYFDASRGLQYDGKTGYNVFPGETVDINITATFDVSAGNEYQNAEFIGNLQFKATQVSNPNEVIKREFDADNRVQVRYRAFANNSGQAGTLIGATVGSYAHPQVTQGVNVAPWLMEQDIVITYSNGVLTSQVGNYAPVTYNNLDASSYSMLQLAVRAQGGSTVKLMDINFNGMEIPNIELVEPFEDITITRDHLVDFGDNWTLTAKLVTVNISGGAEANRVDIRFGGNRPVR